MIIIKFYGGLGNQLFQYAMLVAVREYYGEEALIDASLYDSYNHHNGLEINRIFNTIPLTAAKDQIKKFSHYTTNYKLARAFHYLLPERATEVKERCYGKYYPEVFEREGDCLYDGYWHHYEYFDKYRDVILKEFTLKEPLDSENQTAFDEFNNLKAVVSVHVRRGDYLKSKLYKGLCGVDYYRLAIEKAKQVAGCDALFVIFSNDINWCKDVFTDLIDPGRIRFIDWNTGADSYKDMILMSACRVNIIANSSFSWWAAYLNRHEDKVVIAPKKWINKDMPNPIQMPDWVLL